MQKSPSSSTAKTNVRPGDRVRVRRQRWTVVAAEPHEKCQIVTLSGNGAFNTGTERQVVTPFEEIDAIETEPGPAFTGVRRWRRVLLETIAQPGSPAELHVAGRCGIDLLPYQLEPALALRRGMATRILLADEVGLGKTIQAGLALAELRQSGAVTRALVLSPAGLRDQWADELASRFALRATVVDARSIRQRAAELPVGENPWSTVSLAITSLDYVKRPEVLPALLASPWDAVVVDEAHALSTGTDRGNAAAALCRKAAYVLLLTATPHSGDHRAFVSLCRTGAVAGDTLLAFRRTRQEVSPGTRRRIHRLMVRPGEAERHMHHLLARFARAFRADRGDVDREAALALMVLQKRAYSSAASLHQSVVRRLSILQEPEPREFAQLALPLDDPTGELDRADEPPSMTTPILADARRERRYLEQLAEAARSAMAHETKLAVLRRQVSRLRRRGETAIIFTEYRDTLLRVQQALPCSSALLHGGLGRQERTQALDAFERGLHGVLLATDAAGEGLNLQRRCRLVINLELPWNPMRLEQRIGRVDRIGQSRTVHAVHLIAAGTGETGILDRLKARVARARADVGAADALGLEEVRLKPDPTPDSPDPDRANLSFVRLQSEAAAEHARLIRTRAIEAARRAGRVPTHDARIPVVRARRPAARRLLADRLLVLLCTDCEDGCGRVVASHLSPLLVPAAGTAGLGPEPHLDRRRIDDVLRTLQTINIDDIDPALADWRSHSAAACSAFWRARLDREQAILLEVDKEPGFLFQPGLFDRRSERAHAHLARHEQVLRDQLARRLALVEIASACRIGASRAILVLVPRGPG